MKYLVVSGGVISGIGKGVLASSTGVLLKSMSLNVTAIKIDPYLNIDAGLMNPNEHGEVFVMDDGGEVDLDLGNYERFLDINLTSKNNITTGKIYNKVINDEREGKYLGKTVQVVPHITNAIKEWINEVAHTPIENQIKPDICIIELGGTVGDIESAPFVEALRQLKKDVGPNNFCLLHVSLVPLINDEQKSKPTQSTVKDLRSAGLIPDIIACRCVCSIEKSLKEKISMFCDVPIENIISVHDCKTIYDVPILLEKEGLDDVLSKKFNIGILKYNNINNLMCKWKNMVNHYNNFNGIVRIAIVGKYTKLSDSYFSIIKALEHASLIIRKKVELVWIESSNLINIDLNNDIIDDKKTNPINDIYSKNWHDLVSCNAIIVPGGFGSRGTEGKIKAIAHARINKIPFLGICFGMQLAVVEFARNVLNLSNANSTEIDPNTSYPIIINMPELNDDKMGGTQRLGARKTKFVVDAKVKKLYNEYNNYSTEISEISEISEIWERHRHRYEVNPEYVKSLEECGLHFVGHDTSKERMEIFELDNHPFFVGSQFHPEYKSRPLKPAPLFVGLLLATQNYYH